MKKVIKSKIFWLVLVIVVIAGGIIIKKTGESTDSIYTTQKVVLDKIRQTVSATGSVKSASEIKLNFNTTGKLAKKNIKVGDEVKAGQILATLEASKLAIDVQKAQANLQVAVANLEKVKAGSTAEEIAVAEADVAKAETDLTNAKIDLEDTKLTYSQDIANERDDALTECEKALTKADISLETANDILTNSDYEPYLSVKSSSSIKTANSSYDAATESSNNSNSSVDRAKADTTDDNTNQAINDTLDTLDLVAEYLLNASDVLANSVIGGALTQTKLDTLKSSVNTEKTTTDTSKENVQGAKQDLTDARLDYETEVNDAQATVEAKQKALAKAQADLDLKKAPARPEDIDLYEAKVAQALAELRLAQDKYNDTILKAPINGVITDINYEVGEQTSTTEAAIVMLNTSAYEIEVDVPESDIAKVRVGNPVEITLDAFTDDIIFTGTVITINPAQSEIQEVIYYKVTVTFNDEQAEEISGLMEQVKPGMTANLDIMTDKKENVLIIPQRAVKEKDGKKVVQVLVDSKVQEKEVSLGLRGDEGLVEVISGLKEGEEVITFIKEKK